MAVRTFVPVLTIKIGLKKALLFSSKLKPAKPIATSAL
jgi:hypothetical protein